MTFLINQNGVVYEKDLGKTTNEQAKTIAEFNPAKTWKVVEQHWKASDVSDNAVANRSDRRQQIVRDRATELG